LRNVSVSEYTVHYGNVGSRNASQGAT
jgi:hypothetical protein